MLPISDFMGPPSNRSCPHRVPSVASTDGIDGETYARMFTARAATSRSVIAASIDSAAIRVLARRVSGIESVGLNAIELVREI